jgi:hypothetical protein
MSEYQTTFFRQSVSADGAMTLVIGKGKNAAGIDIIVRRVRAYCVRGEIRDGNGVLMADVAIALEADSWSAGIINEGGRFLLTNLPAGSYTVVVSDRPKPGHILARQVIRVATGNIAGLVIRVPSRSR